MKRLDRPFFERPTLEVAQDLIGKRMHFNGIDGLITETEAYIGQGDPACHAARGRTSRTDVMFGPAGVTYVYLIYGMYHCLNFVTEEEGFPAAVLIRAIRIKGVPDKKLNGPGKLCRFLGITQKQNKIDLTLSNNFYLTETGLTLPYETTTRIGISAGKDKPWRFVA